MREAVVEAKLAVGETREAVARTERDLTRERQRLADAERRGRLASEIQDRETVEVAQRFAAKHRERAGVLAKKLAALQGELALYERELGDMQAQLGRAERDRPLTEAERSAERAWRDLQAAGGPRPGVAPSGGPTSSYRGARSQSSPRAPSRASSRTWARPAMASRSRRYGRPSRSCSRRSTSSHRPCAGRFRASTTWTSSNGSSGWASFSGPRSAPSPSSRTTCSSDESPTRLVVVRSPPRSVHALLHRDVGAVQLLRDARVPHPVHDEGARLHRSEERRVGKEWRSGWSA